MKRWINRIIGKLGGFLRRTRNWRFLRRSTNHADTLAGVEAIASLRASLDGRPETCHRQLIVSGDFLRRLPERTTYIGRIRKDSKYTILCLPARATRTASRALWPPGAHPGTDSQGRFHYRDQSEMLCRGPALGDPGERCCAPSTGAKRASLCRFRRWSSNRSAIVCAIAPNCSIATRRF
jgi:hypothetical protein